MIGADFQGLSAEEQERQREEWKAELKKTEEEILTLKQVLTAKERHAAGGLCWYIKSDFSLFKKQNNKGPGLSTDPAGMTGSE